MTEINDSAVVKEVLTAFEQYERALIANDVATVISMFWESPHTIRFGPGESLYGADEIGEFRRTRPTVDVARRIERQCVTTFGRNFGVASVEYTRVASGAHGRQSQVWVRMQDGWKVVHAHVSDLRP